MASFFSDKLASPRGASCPLFSSGSHSFLSAACFALPLARLAGSSGLAVRFRMTFASPSPFSSSTSSLRIAWVEGIEWFFPLKEAHFYSCLLQVTPRCASRGKRKHPYQRKSTTFPNQVGGALACKERPRRD